MSCSERRKEIKRRRHRRAKLAKYAKKVKSSNVSETAAIAEKLRGLTSGADVIIEAWGLDKR